MSKPQRVYEWRSVATGWVHRCENPTCDRIGCFYSKRVARFCSNACRQIEHTRENRLAREFKREHGPQGQSEG